MSTQTQAIQELRSKTAWREHGRKVKKDATGRGRRKVYVGRRGKRVDYDVYAFEDTEVAAKRTLRPPRAIDPLAAIWVINRRAKRCRDMAVANFQKHRHRASGRSASEKRRLYELKSLAIHYLRQESRVSRVGYHTFKGEDDDALWAEVLEGEGYTFHCPCPAPAGVEPLAVLNRIEAKPRRAGEPRLKDAIFTLKLYLRDKPRVQTFSWDKRRPTRRRENHTRAEDWENQEEEGSEAW